MQRSSEAVADVHRLGLPAAAAVDPFTEEPLRIIKTKSGWVVYSLGETQKEIALENLSTGSYVVGKLEDLPQRKK